MKFLQQTLSNLCSASQFLIMLHTLGTGSIGCREQGSLTAESIQPHSPLGELTNDDDDVVYSMIYW